MITWQELAKNFDKYGDIEAQEGGDIYRGPIKSITIKGDWVAIENDWVATMPGPGQPGTGKWSLYSTTGTGANMKEVELREIGDGRLMFMAPMLGPMIIFPKTGSRLDPRLVAGHALYDPNFTLEAHA